MPGSEVTFDVQLQSERFGILTGKGEVRVGERRVADATLKGYSGGPDASLR
jgi:hypothetical protein